MHQGRRDVSHALPGHALPADEMEFIVDVIAVEFGTEFIEAQRRIDAVGCQVELAPFDIFGMEIEIVGNILFGHILNGMAVEGHHLFGPRLGGKEPAESQDAQGHDCTAYFLP